MVAKHESPQVWADGLGNQEENALHQCQLSHIARRVQALQTLVEGRTSSSPNGYRVWIGALCCPVELEGKMKALQRIAKVYQDATHVLVFDSSISTLVSTKLDAAELCLRALGTSTWMRRLWTLQGIVLRLIRDALNGY